MIRGIVFDMDGVLVDTEQFYEERRREFLQKKGIRQASGTDFTGSNEQAIWEGLVPDDPALRQALKLEYREYQKAYPIPFAQVLDPEVWPLFSALKKRGYGLAIASSSDRDAIEAMMVTAGIENLVDFYISGGECRAHKPDPEIYQRALAALGLGPDEAFAVEDSTPGIAAAKNAGLKVFALCQKGNAKIDQSAADKIIYRLSDVLTLLESALSPA